jgi:hypothetical protein
VNTTPRIASSACFVVGGDFYRKNVIGKGRTGGELALLKIEEFRHSRRRRWFVIQLTRLGPGF